MAEVNILKQKLRSAEGRLRKQRKAKGSNAYTTYNKTVTYVPPPVGAPPGALGTYHIVGNGNCNNRVVECVAPQSFVDSWTGGLDSDPQRIVTMSAFVCSITAGEYCDVLVNSTTQSPFLAANAGAPVVLAGVGANFHIPKIRIPKGKTVEVIFSAFEGVTNMGEIHRRLRKAFNRNILLGAKRRVNPHQYDIARHVNPRGMWCAEFQDVVATPVSPAFTLTVDPNTFVQSEFRHFPANQPYQAASVEWKSITFMK